jgi:Mg2+/Co2+ transporter CorB
MRFSARTAKPSRSRSTLRRCPKRARRGRHRFARQQQYSRVLLHKGDSLDDVVGYLAAKDLVFDRDAAALSNLQSLRRDVLFVPEAQGLVDVPSGCSRPTRLRGRRRRIRRDGITTMEDVLEEIGRHQRRARRRNGAHEKKGPAWEVDGRVTPPSSVPSASRSERGSAANRSAPR